MKAFVRNVLLVFAALFPIVNPVGMAPIFASMTLPYSSGIRRTMAMRIAINGIVLLVASIFIGSYILEFFGISIAAVQFGGGLVVTVSGWHILNRRTDVADRQSDAPQRQLRDSLQGLLSADPAAYGWPRLDRRGHHAGQQRPLGNPPAVDPHGSLAAVIGSVLIGLSIYLSYAYADKLEKLLGSNGHQHPDTAVGVHRAVHRNSDHVQRLGGVLQGRAAFDVNRGRSPGHSR